MDRVIHPTQTARTMRERVEARRARTQKVESAHHSGENARDAVNTRQKATAPAPSQHSFDLPWMPRQRDEQSSVRSADKGRFVPGRFAAGRDASTRPAAGSMAVPRGHRRRSPALWSFGGGRTRQSWGGFAAVASFGKSLAQGWQELDPDLQRIVKRVAEFVIALLVVAGLGISLFSGTGRPVKATNGTNGAAPTAAVQAVAAEKPSEPVRIMLLGSDMRSGDSGFRTDVMLLLTIDAQNGKVSVLSFPRDLVGKIPGYGDGRINIVMGRGGFSLMQDTFEESYGVRPQYYFLINFEGFVGLINSIGGIEINAAEHLEDSCDLPQSRAGICTIEPGKHSMDGATALWYVRSRHSSSDFDRLRRAQEVMGGIFDRMMSMQAVTRLPELYLQYSQDVETNMTIPQIAGLLPSAVNVAGDPQQIERYAIPSEITADWFMPDGARVLLPDYEAVRKFVREATFIK